MDALNDKRILTSWENNVSQWTKAVREAQIESRKLVTDQAIVDAILSLSAKSVLDVGCGEGWLVRELFSRGLSVAGLDASAGLIDRAKAHVGGDYQVLEYTQLSVNTIAEKYDVAVGNFSLIGKESVEHVFKVIPEILNDKGRFIVQTLHPHTSCGNVPYRDGWRKGSWQGFSDDFVDPAPWYYRTIESWTELYAHNGLTLETVREPVNPNTGKAASLLMIGRTDG
jgi:2-polyprenyl-3-methyl-5-hydroxy-6-metoxy-1,4-benzoquinol methylase